MNFAEKFINDFFLIKLYNPVIGVSSFNPLEFIILIFYLLYIKLENAFEELE